MAKRPASGDSEGSRPPRLVRMGEKLWAAVQQAAARMAADDKKPLSTAEYIRRVVVADIRRRLRIRVDSDD